MRQTACKGGGPSRLLLCPSFFTQPHRSWALTWLLLWAMEGQSLLHSKQEGLLCSEPWPWTYFLHGVGRTAWEHTQVHQPCPTASLSQARSCLLFQFPLPPRALCLEGFCHLEGVWLRELQDCLLLYLIPPIRGGLLRTLKGPGDSISFRQLKADCAGYGDRCGMTNTSAKTLRREFLYVAVMVSIDCQLGRI